MRIRTSFLVVAWYETMALVFTGIDRLINTAELYFVYRGNREAKERDDARYRD